MLTITVKGKEFFDQETSKFVSVDNTIVQLEHSLVSLSKWESKFQKPFLGSAEKTKEEILWYFYFMVISPGVDPEIVFKMSQENYEEINAYIASRETATTFPLHPEKRGRGETITAELIYYWMLTLNIPLACEAWHLNKLFTLIRVTNIKNAKPKKMSAAEIAARNREINAQRRKELNTTG